MCTKPTTGNEQKTIFELSSAGRRGMRYPECDVPKTELPAGLLRDELPMPELSEADVVRHFTNLSELNYSLDNGFYPLGSCTMKYNPKIDEKLSRLDGFVNVHPLQPIETVQGSLLVMYELQDMLQRISGMDACTLTPAAGAHGEFTGLLLIKAYHTDRGDTERNEIIVPDAAHGTNPASATMAGYKTIVIKSNENGTVDIDDLKAHLGPKTAGLMLTNPNTVGLFDPNIMEITRLVHEAGGLCYYDGANLNAVIGIVRPADIGFDVIHMNLHKTFSTPHGGGGPGSGPCAYKDFLAPFAPGLVCKDGENYERAEKSIGNLTGFYGNFLVMVKAYTYLLTIGKEVYTLAQNAVLNANYMQEKLKDIYPIAFDTTCMHEFVIGLDPIYRKTHVSALDVAKALLDYGIHPPTIYFPLIVHEALMIEPTETETKETLDEAITAFREIYERIFNAPESVQMAPQTTPVLRLDDTKAAREPHLRYIFD